MKHTATKTQIAYMPIVRVTGNYQMTIPVHIRTALGVQVGDYIEVILDENGMAKLKPVEIVTKKKTKRTEPKLREKTHWKQLGQEQFFKQYDEKDAAYDKIKL